MEAPSGSGGGTPLRPPASAYPATLAAAPKGTPEFGPGAGLPLNRQRSAPPPVSARRTTPPPARGGAAPSTAPAGNLQYASVGQSGHSLGEFFTAVLQQLGAPVTQHNVNLLLGWAQAEGGDTHNSASWNPLNTTQGSGSSSSINSVGVQAYGSFQDGVAATVKTLTNGYYGNIVSALQSGSASPDSFATMVGQSKWGTNLSTVSSTMRQVFGGSQGAFTGSTAMRGGPGGSASGGAGAGGLGGGGGGQTNNVPAWDEKSFQSELASQGYGTAFINSDKSLQALFRSAVQNKWDATEFYAHLQQTNWWKTRSATQRQYDQEKFQDPNTFNRKNAVTSANLVHQAAQMGFTLSQQRADALAQTVNRNGLDPSEIQSALGAEIHYNPNNVYGGDIGRTVSSIRQLGQDYNVPLDENTLGQWATNVASGKTDIATYENFVKQQSMTKYPWLADQIKSGLSVKDIASPFKGEMANLLEVDPASIKTSDPMIAKGLQYTDPTNQKAGYSTMPIYQFQNMVRQDPRWLKTDNARDSMMDTVTGVLKTFGLEA